MTAEATVIGLIDDQNARATTALEAAVAAAEEAQLAAISMVSLPSVPNISAPTVNVPSDQYQWNAVSEYEQAFNGKLADFNPQFASEWAAFIDTYFPDIAGCIRDNSDDWICNTIANGGTGIPAAVEAQIWGRERSRQLTILMEAKDKATNEWAARGFSLPPGALLDRISAAEQDYIEKIAQSSRDTAIKNIEIEIENIRFAVTKAVDLRLGAIKAAIDYVLASFKPTELAIDYAKALTEAHFRFFQGMGDYYQAIIGAARLTLDASIANSQKDARVNESFAQLSVGLTSARAQAAASAAASLARAAAAALGALNSVADVSNITNE